MRWSRTLEAIEKGHVLWMGNAMHSHRVGGTMA